MKSKVEKITDALNDKYDEINEISNSYIGKDDKKYKFFSNICHELHQITEQLEEFNWNK